MNQPYWQKQSKDQPLFPNIMWSRPETKQGAGKLLIIGGQAEEFIQVAESYNAAEKAGAGTVRVIMPDSTAKVTKMLPNIEYAPSNSSGSFAKNALAELLEVANWADGVLLAGNLGKNSETSLMLDSFIKKFKGFLIISGYATHSLTIDAKEILNRDSTALILSLPELQKILTNAKFQTPLTSKAGDVTLAQILHKATQDFKLNINLVNKNTYWSSSKGRVASTELQDINLSNLAALSAVWLIQQPNKIFEALASSAYDYL